MQELKTSLLKVVDAAANQVASGAAQVLNGAAQLVSAVESIGNFVASHEASPPRTTAAIQYQVTLTDEDGQQYDADPLQVAVNVPLSKQLAYDASKVLTSVAGKAMKAGVAALVAGQAPVAAALLAVDVAGLVAAYKLYYRRPRTRSIRTTRSWRPRSPST